MKDMYDEGDDQSTGRIPTSYTNHREMADEKEQTQIEIRRYGI